VAVSLLLQPLLGFNNLSDCSVVVLELLDRFSVIQVYKHISQVRSKLGLSFVHLLLSLLGLVLLSGSGLLPLGLLSLLGLTLVLLPLRVFRINSVTFVFRSERFTRKLFFVLWLFPTVLVLLILVFFLVCVVLAFVLVNVFFIVEVVSRIGVCFLLMLVNDFLHSDDWLLLCVVTISISHYF
jgi:hypothetical protein